MKDESDAIRVTRWIDGEVEDSEIHDLLEADPSLQELRHAAKEFGAMVSQEMNPEVEVPFPELFNRQILRRIEQEQAKGFQSRARRFFLWLSGSEWGLPVAASATLLGLLFAGLLLQGPTHFRSKVVHTFTPNPAHVAKTTENQRAGVSVIALEGLAPVPADSPVLGYSPTESRREPMLAATSYCEGSKPVLLLSLNAAGEPRLQSLR